MQGVPGGLEGQPKSMGPSGKRPSCRVGQTEHHQWDMMHRPVESLQGKGQGSWEGPVWRGPAKVPTGAVHAAEGSH
jgi:hypothetical protein